MYDPETATVYLASFIQNGDTHRIHMDEFDWANLVNLGYEVFDVEETDMKWQPAKMPKFFLTDEEL